MYLYCFQMAWYTPRYIQVPFPGDNTFQFFLKNDKPKNDTNLSPSQKKVNKNNTEAKTKQKTEKTIKSKDGKKGKNLTMKIKKQQRRDKAVRKDNFI